MANAFDSIPRGRSLRRLYSDYSESSPAPQSFTSAMKSTAKRPGQAVADAAATAEFNEKKWVWIADTTKGYVAGWIVKEDVEPPEGKPKLGNLIEVRTVDDQTNVINSEGLEKMNPPKFDKVEDIADLTFLNEASVVHNLRQRYEAKMIYTYSGLFLVAINPYHPLPIYTPSVISQYKNRRREENPPHVYAVAERAWQNMVGEREGQSILITGESGAGKTENTKRVIGYLTAVAGDATGALPASGSEGSLADAPDTKPRSGLSIKKASRPDIVADRVGKRLGRLERQILQANPVLESFGNAQTVRNNNSSRFGKFVRIEFSSAGVIAGANIDWYLLEKSRVTARSEAERCFHVFYQLLRGSDADLQKRLLLETVDPTAYEYLKHSRNQVEGMDDAGEWKALAEALDIVGFSKDEQFDLFKVVAAVLHIGNIPVAADRSESALIKDDQGGTAVLEKVGHLLGLPVEEFRKALLRPRIKAGREWVTQARTKKQVTDEMGSLCTTVYEKAFGAMVEKINRMLERKMAQHGLFIGVLDIAGFEIFDVNGFEQLCINYTNERLQQFFNHHMFVLEQEEYAREDIDWDFVNFGLDLQPTIDLIESTNPIGILSCLDEECIMPRASDKTFTEKLTRLVKESGNTKFAPARFEQGFVVKHYAGQVEYRTEGWLDKNKDPLNANLTSVLAASTDKFIASLFEDYSDTILPPANGTAAAPPASGFVETKKAGRLVKRGAFRTVGQRHKEQLMSLMTQLQSTSPHFVRCIVPNSHKQPGIIDTPLVLDQLRCNGVLEGIRIARLGYPNRLPFTEFRQRYEVLTPNIIPNGYMDGRKACIRMLSALELDETVYKTGLTKVFFKAGVLAELEEKRDEHLYDIFSRLQAACRMFTAKRKMNKILNRAVAVRTIQRNARIYNELRSWPWWQLYTRVRPLLAATRNDNELRRKEAEINLIKERADREAIEKQKLEALRATLEVEKKRIEEALQSERLLGTSKDEQLHRSKQMEVALVEELETTRKEIEGLEDQLDRESKLHAGTKEQVKKLQIELEATAETVQRLTEEVSQWKEREVTLSNVASSHSTEVEKLRTELSDAVSSRKNLERNLVEKDEDLARAQKRMQVTIAELEGKLAFETDDKKTAKDKIVSLEKEIVSGKDRLMEMTRTTTEYDASMKRKEADFVTLQNQLNNAQKERDQSQKQGREFSSRVDGLTTELTDTRIDVEKERNKCLALQNELDSMRQLLEAKSSDAEKQTEVTKGKERELLELRAQSLQLNAEYSEARRVNVEEVTLLRSQADEARQAHSQASQAYADAAGNLATQTAKVQDLDLALTKAERSKKAIESELQSVRQRQLEMSDELDTAQRERDNLDRQLAAANIKFQDMEDALLKIEREREAWSRQVEDLKARLESESTRRLTSEATGRRLDADLLLHKNAVSDHEKQSASLRKELKGKERELAKAIALQDTTIVEHVHVLEEAKRYTDRQLTDAQSRLQEQVAYVRQLERTNSRMKGEGEDMTREIQQLRATQRKASHIGAADIQMGKALEREKKAKEMSDALVKRLQSELQAAKASALTSVTMANVPRRVSETPPPNDGQLAQQKRQYESRISDLERQVAERHTSRDTMERLKRQVEQRYTDMIQMVERDGPKPDSFKNRLLAELQEANQELESEIASSLNTFGRQPDKMRTFHNASPFKRGHATNGSVARMSRELDQGAQDRNRAHHWEDLARKHERSNNALQADIQVLNMQQSASDVVRRHLENQVRDMHAILSDIGNPGFSADEAQRRLAEENSHLTQLLEQEADARHRAEQARLRGTQALREMQNNITNGLDDRFNQLETSRSTLQSQHRQTTQESDAQKAFIRELTQSKIALEAEINDLRSRYDDMESAQIQDASSKRSLLTRLQEAEIESASAGDLEGALSSWKQKADSYRDKMEAAEVARIAAEKAETYARVSLADAERRRSEAAEDRESAESRAREAEQRLRELQAYIEDEGGDAVKAQQDADRTLTELNDLRGHYDKALKDRDLTVEATRQRFQQELEGVAAELELERDRSTTLREEVRLIRTERDELQMRKDEGLYSRGGFSKEKERLETKIADVTTAYDEALATQAEQSAEIVKLMSQVRDLRTSRDEIEADRAALAIARRGLEDRLDEIGTEFLSANSGRLSNDRILQSLQQERGELKRSLEEKDDYISLAMERQKKAEAFANDCQMEAARERSESTELLKANTDLERKIKALSLRIVDHETRSLATSPRPTTRSADQRHLEDMASQLEVERQNVVKAARKSDRQIEELHIKLADSERLRIRQQDEMSDYEAKLLSVRRQNTELQTSESDLQITKRRAEREAVDSKEKLLRLQTELERYRAIANVRSPGRTASRVAGP